MAEESKKISTVFGDMTEKEIEKKLKELRVSYQMYENSKKDALKKRKRMVDKFGNKMYSEESTEDTMKLMETMQDDIRQKYIKLGGDPNELNVLTKSSSRGSHTNRRKMLMDIMARSKKGEEKRGLVTKDDEEEETEVSTDDNRPTIELEQPEESSSPTANEGIANAVKQNLPYDVIPLPSKGQCYKHKKAKIAVGFLTAFDENLILSKNLYADGTFLDHMLQNKILEDGVNPDEMVEGDREAVIVWLRANSYGTDYPVKVTDNATGQQFETTIDLTKIKTKPFNLIGDKNGHFTYQLPKSKDVITFKYLTGKDIKYLEKMKANDVKDIRINRLKYLTAELLELADDDDIFDSLNVAEKKSLTNAIDTLDKHITEVYENDEYSDFTHELTDRLIAQIVSVNGISDRNYIENYVYHMNIQDAAEFRRYMNENEPGLDFNIEVERPASLGGGLISTFLSLDQFIFVRIAK